MTSFSRRGLLILSSFFLLSTANAQQPALLISGFMANPAGTDDNKEFAELLATRNINFANENFTVVFNDGSNAGTNGWASGSTGSYAITISSGTIAAGEKLYVGGTSYTNYVTTGSTCHVQTRNTSTNAGNPFNGGATGTASTAGVLGNGGAHADGLAVFSGASSTISATSVPIDAIFFGTSVGSASGKFTLPANDRYSGAGKFGTSGNTFLAPDPSSDEFIKATGNYDTTADNWSANRSWAAVSLASTKLNCATTLSGITLSGGTAAGTLTFSPSASQSGFLQMPNVSGVIDNPTDPLSSIGVNLDVMENGTAVPAAGYTVTATSSKTSVVPNANVVFTKSDGQVNVKITPAGIGYATITLKVTKGTATKNYVINYAASASSDNITTARYHTGYSDGSAALALDNDYMVVADDENNILAVYDRNNSGLAVKSFAYGANLSLSDLSGGVPREVDAEAVVASIANPGRSYWMGSMSNKSSASPFDARPNRDRIFAVTTSGTGSSTAFNFVGYAQLRSQIISWGSTNSLGLAASAASGKDPKQIDGFNLEGMTFAPDNTTLYLGFRAPLLPTGNRVNALIAPVQNFEAWFGNGNPSTNPTIGSPILLNLQGRGIREIFRQTANRYIIVAGDYDDAGARTSKVFQWNGSATDAPTELTGYDVSGLNPEGVVSVYNGTSLETHTLQFISDLGSVEQYNDGIASKDLTDAEFKKFRSDVLVDAISPLPVRFTSFSASRIAAGKAKLRWMVASIDAAYFEVERSADGAAFQTIASVKAEKSLPEYEFIDADPSLTGVRYYRIKGTDAGGKVYYTNLQQVRFDIPAFTVNLYPNPVKTGQVTLDCEGVVAGSSYVISRVDGSIIATGILQNGANFLAIGHLSGGMYSLKITSGNEVKTMNFIKE